jgi:uncharacterized protein YjbI with pentapeptide repeats
MKSWIVSALLVLGLGLLPGLADSARAGDKADFLAALSKDCRGCNLSGANLKRFDLTGADLAGANLTGANLHRAKLTGANLAGANLTGANLNKADLRRTNLAGARLGEAMLFEADLSGSDLSRADLSGALMGSSHFTFATLEGPTSPTQISPMHKCTAPS